MRASEFRWRHFSAFAISSSSSGVCEPWLRLHSFGGDDGCHFLDRAVENIVDENIVIFAVILNLVPGLGPGGGG